VHGVAERRQHETAPSWRRSAARRPRAGRAAGGARRAAGAAGQAARLVVLRAGALGGAGDDERRARLVDQDAVHLVDDAEVEVAQHQVLAFLRGALERVRG